MKNLLFISYEWVPKGIIKLEMSDIETTPFESSSRKTDEKMYVIICKS